MLKKILLLLVFIAFRGVPAFAQTTRTAVSCSKTHVEDKIALSSDDDTVELPSCPSGVTWTGTLTLLKAITIRGATNCTLTTATQGAVSISIPSSCDSVILDNSSASFLFDITLVANKTTRLSNLEVRNSSSSHGSGSAFLFRGATGAAAVDDRRFRLDHIKTDVPGFTVRPYCAYGVVDHNSFVLSAGSETIYPKECTYAWSDARWHDPVNLGSDEAVVVEDNKFDRTGHTIFAAGDGFSGARVVYRKNIFINSWVELHGTETANRYRGGRLLEVYRNDFASNNTGATIVNVRSGVGIVWQNAATGHSGATSGAAAPGNTRATGDFKPWGSADGNNPWDVNDGSNPILTLTVASATATTVTISGQTWTANQYRGYTIHKAGCLSDYTDAGRPTCGAIISGNNAVTAGNGVLTFVIHDGTIPLTGGDTIYVGKVTHVLDAPCRGQGTALVVKTISAMTSVGTTATATITGHGYSTGDWIAISDASASFATTRHNGTYQITLDGVDPTNKFTFTMFGTQGGTYDVNSGLATKLPAGIPYDQVTEKCYEWQNTHAGTSIHFAPAYYDLQIRANEHYYDYAGSVQSNATTPFNGTAGMGVGSWANRPTTCVDGTGYFADDRGSWNTSGDGLGDGLLYVCASNDWVLSYTPYDYPHPLTAGDLTPPVPGSSPVTSAVTPTTLTVSWGAATGTAPLTYYLGRSTSAIANTAACLSATMLQDYTAAFTTYDDTGRTPLSTYVYCVIVKDGDDLTTMYPTVSQTMPCGASKVVFTDQPSDAVLGATLGTVTVQIQNASSALCTDDSTSSVTLTKDSGATWGTLDVTGAPPLTQTVTGGIGTWSNLNVTILAGAGCIDVTSAGLTGECSDVINISNPLPPGVVPLGKDRSRRR